MNANERKVGRASALALVLVALMLNTSVAAAQEAPVDGSPNKAPGEDLDYEKNTVVVEKNLDEGKISMQLGDAEMFVHYGDGVIEFASIQTRYLGIADLYDDQKGFRERVGIPVESIFYQRLLGVVEYVDTNENGLFDVDGNAHAGTIEELDDFEEVAKWIELEDVEWQLSHYSMSQNGNEVNIDFTISATDIPYQNEDGPITSETVALIAYYFHVTSVEEDVSISAAPHYRVMYDEEASAGDQIDGSTKVADTNVSGTVLNTSWKYDQDIQGWDIATDEVGVERNDTRLAVLTEMAYGAHMNPAVGEWMMEEHHKLMAPKAIAGKSNTRFSPPPGQAPNHIDLDDEIHDEHGRPLQCGLAYVSADGYVGEESETEGRAMEQESTEDSDDSDVEDSKEEEERHKQEKVMEKIREYKETACHQRGEEISPDSDMQRPEAIRAGSIHFEDNGANLGRVRWVSNATVDGVETEVLFQVHGVRPVLPIDVEGKQGIWAGVRMVGGYNYVLGESVYHDPEFSSDVMILDTQSFGEPTVYGATTVLSLMIIRLALIGGVAMVALASVGVAVSNRTRRSNAPLPATKQFAPSGAWSADDDWSQYQR